MLCSHKQGARRMLFLLPSLKIEGRKERKNKTQVKQKTCWEEAVGKKLSSGDFWVSVKANRAKEYLEKMLP